MAIRSKWQPFKKTYLQDLPLKETGVYEIGKASSDTIYYIGKSDRCIRSRLLKHRAESRFSGCTHFRKRITDPEDAQETELQLQKQYFKKYGKLPRLNKNISPGDTFRGKFY